VLVIVVTVGGYVLVAFATDKLPPNVAILLAWVFRLYLVAHLAVPVAARRRTLLPIAAMLNGLGFVLIARLAGGGRTMPSGVQSVWVTIGIVVFVVT
jgi:hypothetical protein